MKKFLSVLIILVFLVNNNVYAASTFNVKIDGKKATVKQVDVKIDSKALKSDFNPYVVNGRTFVPIREITESLGATVEWDNKVKSATIKLNDKEVKLKIDSNVIYTNGEKSVLENDSIPKFAVYSNPKNETKTMVPLRFLSEAFGFNVSWDSKANLASIKTVEEVKASPISSSIGNTNSYVSNVEKQEANNLSKSSNEEVFSAAGLDVSTEETKRTVKVTDKITTEGPLNIVIDPGHGGKDNGATAVDGTFEKELNLKVATRLYDRLVSSGYNVTMTRSSDEYIKLLDRASESNNSDAEIFLSIHFNSSDNKAARGIEVLYASEDSVNIKTVKQKTLASELLESLIKETGMTNRGVKNRPDLVVLNKTKNVSAMAELGFISNESDFKLIDTDEYIDKFVNGLYNGLVNYINSYVENK